jgi:hypothetical protein
MELYTACCMVGWGGGDLSGGRQIWFLQFWGSLGSRLLLTATNFNGLSFCLVSCQVHPPFPLARNSTKSQCHIVLEGSFKIKSVASLYFLLYIPACELWYLLMPVQNRI